MVKKENIISIVEAGGTGIEVSDIFKKIVKKLCDTNITFLSFKDEFGYYPSTFVALQKKFYNKNWEELKIIVQKEKKDLINFYNETQIKSIGMFRTAVNAETLYYVRKDIKKLKAIVLPVKIGNINKNIIFVRDQLQGYYTNEKFLLKNDEININLKFSYENFLLLTRFTKEFIDKLRIKNYDLFYVYKYHLFGLELQKMIERAVKKTNIKLKDDFHIFQPDTAMHKLLGGLSKIKSENVVVVVGNEIGDVLLEALVHYFGIANKETFYTLNVAFIDKKQKLEVLQTMHGSADDIAGKQLLNPLAAIRAAGYALENWLMVPNAVNRIEKAIQKAIHDKILTKDMGGKSKTDEVVDYIINNL